MTTLTDRYVSAVAGLLPADTRDDVSAELRATIADTVDARPDGVSESEAEREAIRELGHPSALAEQFRPGGPRHLIGPTVFPIWLMLIKIIVPIAAVAAGLVNGIAEFVSDGGVGDAIGSGVFAAWNAAAIAAIALTAIAAFKERRNDDTGVFGAPFDPDTLPEPGSRGVRLPRRRR